VSQIELSRDDAVQRIRMNRPDKKNALTLHRHPASAVFGLRWPVRDAVACEFAGRFHAHRFTDEAGKRAPGIRVRGPRHARRPGRRNLGPHPMRQCGMAERINNPEARRVTPP
jgi:hypothetical protein